MTIKLPNEVNGDENSNSPKCSPPQVVNVTSPYFRALRNTLGSSNSIHSNTSDETILMSTLERMVGKTTKLYTMKNNSDPSLNSPHYKSTDVLNSSDRASSLDGTVGQKRLTNISNLSMPSLKLRNSVYGTDSTDPARLSFESVISSKSTLSFQKPLAMDNKQIIKDKSSSTKGLKIITSSFEPKAMGDEAVVGLNEQLMDTKKNQYHGLNPAYSKEEEEFHTSVFSGYLYKKSRNGQFQKRVCRLDGFMFVCLEEAANSNVPEGIPLYELNPGNCESDNIKKQLDHTIKLNYPFGTPIPGLSLSLIAPKRGPKDLNPDIASALHHEPKWVIPVNTIVALVAHDPSGDPAFGKTRSFTIVTQEREYVFRAPNMHALQRWHFLLTNMSRQVRHSLKESNTPDNADIFHELTECTGYKIQECRTQVFERFVVRRQIWEKLLFAILEKEPNVAENIQYIWFTVEMGVQSTNGIAILLKQSGDAARQVLHRVKSDPTSISTREEVAKKRSPVDNYLQVSKKLLKQPISLEQVSLVAQSSNLVTLGFANGSGGVAVEPEVTTRVHPHLHTLDVDDITSSPIKRIASLPVEVINNNDELTSLTPDSSTDHEGHYQKSPMINTSVPFKSSPLVSSRQKQLVKNATKALAKSSSMLINMVKSPTVLFGKRQSDKDELEMPSPVESFSTGSAVKDHSDFQYPSAGHLNNFLDETHDTLPMNHDNIRAAGARPRPPYAMGKLENWSTPVISFENLPKSYEANPTMSITDQRQNILISQWQYRPSKDDINFSCDFMSRSLVELRKIPQMPSNAFMTRQLSTTALLYHYRLLSWYASIHIAVEIERFKVRFPERRESFEDRAQDVKTIMRRLDEAMNEWKYAVVEPLMKGRGIDDAIQTSVSRTFNSDLSRNIQDTVSKYKQLFN